MKAVLLHGYGSVDQLVYEEVPIPVAGTGEVLVKLISTSINPIDYKVRRGDMKNIMPLQLPAILGLGPCGSGCGRRQRSHQRKSGFPRTGRQPAKPTPNM